VTAESCVAAFADGINELDGDVVLVAHSLGASAVPAVLQRLRQPPRRLVIVAGILPAAGHAPIDLAPAPIRSVARWRGTVPNVPRPVAARLMANGMDRGQRARLEAVQVPETAALHLARRPSGAFTVPVTWVLTRNDRMFSPRRQRRFIENVGTTVDVVEIESGHYPLITHPRLLAETIASYCD
jgi:pimeloyl-ACP methyl ester carboxylesterase